MHKTMANVTGYDLDSCRTESEAACSVESLLQLQWVNYSCPDPCRRVQYNGRMETQEGYLNKSVVMINPQLASKRVTVYEEVLLFDLATFVGSFGGSLGLFIGFSFFDFTTMFSDVVINFIAKKNHMP